MNLFKLYRKPIIIIFISACYLNSFAQQDTTAQGIDSEMIDSANHKMVYNNSTKIFKIRQQIVGYSSIAAYGGLLYTLNKAWYAQYPRSAFHLYNDNGEWNQVDKAGHAWTAYQLSTASYRAWKWAGVSDKKALLYAGISGPGFLTVIEILDGFSKKWGFSLGDMGANIFGSTAFLAQQAIWKEQKVSLKFSFHKNNYAEAMLETRADNLFGKSWNERMLKDYNAQTYWLSANLHAIFPENNFPKWLNIAIGYGADGMFGGYKNEWTDATNNTIDRTDIKRIRQFYISPDVDLTKIKTRSKFLKTTFYLFNSLKFPAPALMCDSRGKMKAYLFYF